MDGKGGMPSLRETLRGHVRGGHEVTLLLPGYDLFSADLTPISTTAPEGVEVHVAPCRWLPALKSLRAAATRIGGGRMPYLARWALNLAVLICLTVSMVLAAWRIVYRRKRRFDLVYAHNQYAALAGRIIGRSQGIPNVTRLYGTFLGELIGKPLVWLRYPSLSAGYLVPHDLLICANDGTEGDLVARKLLRDQSRFRFWQNGVDLPGKPPDTSRRQLVEQFGGEGLRAESRWVVSCSRLSYWKRIDRILRAVAECRRLGCDCQAVIAGDGDEREALGRLAEELGIAENTIWLGSVAHDDIWALMNVADAFIITNDVTNRCNPVYEAICARLPVVSVKDRSTADLLEHEVNALLADKDDCRALGEHLATLCRDKALAGRLREGQGAKAEAMWAWEQRMNVEVRELERLVSHDKPGRHASPTRGRNTQ
jgi:glycosyltransferase involved in cell wall biosynthesis